MKVNPLFLLMTLIAQPASANSVMGFEGGWEGFSQPGAAYIESFYRRQYYTPTSNTGPNGGAEGTTYFVNFETSSGSAYSAGNMAYMRADARNTSILSFYYHMYGADIGTLAVEVRVQSAANWERVWELSGQQQSSSNDAWKQQVINLASYPIAKEIRFLAIAKGGDLGDIGIDQIRLEDKANTMQTFHYDALGRLICAGDDINGNRSYEYDDAGNRDKVIVGNPQYYQNVGNCE